MLCTNFTISHSLFAKTKANKADSEIQILILIQKKVSSRFQVTISNKPKPGWGVCVCVCLTQMAFREAEAQDDHVYGGGEDQQVVDVLLEHPWTRHTQTAQSAAAQSRENTTSARTARLVIKSVYNNNNNNNNNNKTWIQAKVVNNEQSITLIVTWFGFYQTHWKDGFDEAVKVRYITSVETKCFFLSWVSRYWYDLVEHA